MARGIAFPEANLVLTAPTPEDAAAGTVYDLHVHRYRDLDGQMHVISKWQLTPGEIEDIQRSKAVWLDFWGSTQPPAAISGHSPFLSPQARSATAPSEAAQILRDLFCACVEWAGKSDAILPEMPAEEMARAQQFLGPIYGNQGG